MRIRQGTWGPQVDPARALIGSSPALGDRSNVGVVLPAFASTQANRRFLVRLCGVVIARGWKLTLHTLRQLLTIGAEAPGNQEDPELAPFRSYEVEVTTPHWSFQNGNVSWHLRRVMWREPIGVHFTDFVFLPPNNSDFAGIGPGILSRVPPTAPGAYRPPHGGAPYGNPVYDLGTFYDVRFGWNRSDQILDYEVVGPCKLIFYASVYQPEPDERLMAPIQDPSCLCPEDRFSNQFPAATYRRVAGRMTYTLEEIDAQCQRVKRSCK